jgi:hypothetical protein
MMKNRFRNSNLIPVCFLPIIDTGVGFFLFSCDTRILFNLYVESSSTLVDLVIDLIVISHPIVFI